MRSKSECRKSKVLLVKGRAEALPFRDHYFDTLVTAWTLCSIDDIEGALREFRRVLQPRGKLLFIEHGRSSEDTVTKWQDLRLPVTMAVSGGCRINRPIEKLLRNAGFQVLHMTTHYAGVLKPFVFMYEGCAVNP